MGEKEIELSFSELARLEVYCSKCQASLSFNMLEPIPQLAGSESVTRQCPVCKELFPEKAQHALMLYNNFLCEVKQSKLLISA
jgi:hypothetical protein